MGAYDLNPFYEDIIEALTAQNFAVVDHFFEPEQIHALRDNLKRKQQLDSFQKAAIGQDGDKQIAANIRGDFILWLDADTTDAIEQSYFSQITQFIDYINRTCYLGIQDGEFHYACYPTGSFYQRHLDVFHHDSRRTLSIVLYLNEDDWHSQDGGQLALYLPSETGETTRLVEPKAGRMIIFDSKTIPHEVLCTKRPRYSITGWLRTR